MGQRLFGSTKYVSRRLADCSAAAERIQCVAVLGWAGWRWELGSVAGWSAVEVLLAECVRDSGYAFLASTCSFRAVLD